MSTVAAHQRADHCVCRCGEDEEVYMPPFERECRRFENECTTNDGVSSTWRCQ